MTVIMTRPEARPAPPRCRTDVLELGAYDSAVPSARLHARAVLREWHLDFLQDDVESVVAETITNAVQATRDAGLDTGVRLTLIADDDGVLIVVWDAVPLQPVLNNPDADSEHGRGCSSFRLSAPGSTADLCQVPRASASSSAPASL